MSNPVSLSIGALSTLLVITLSLAMCAAMAPDFLIGWATLALVSMVPTQIVISLVWRCGYPQALAGLSQPWRGLAFAGLNVLVGSLVGLLAWGTIGGGVSPPAPFVNMFLIFSVPVMLFLVIVLQTWPFRNIFQHSGLLGLALLIATYGLAWLLFRTLFNFGFMAGAPFYKPDLDPQGVFMAWQPLVASIAAVVPMLALVLFDFWPVSVLARRFPRLASPLPSALIAALIVVAGAGLLWMVCVELAGMELVSFMIRICVSLCFGLFILLVMFEGMPGLALAQPWRGMVLCLVGAVLASALLFVYQAIATAGFALPSGAPAYPLELWLGSAMLGVTFPAMVAFAGYFQFWPLRRTS
jgi:hypothetical protein